MHCLSSPCLTQELWISSQGSGVQECQHHSLGMPRSAKSSLRHCTACKLLLCHYRSNFTDLTELNLTALTQNFLEMQGSIWRLKLLLCHLLTEVLARIGSLPPSWEDYASTKARMAFPDTGYQIMANNLFGENSHWNSQMMLNVVWIFRLSWNLRKGGGYVVSDGFTEKQFHITCLISVPTSSDAGLEAPYHLMQACNPSWILLP